MERGPAIAAGHAHPQTRIGTVVAPSTSRIVSTFGTSLVKAALRVTLIRALEPALRASRCPLAALPVRETGDVRVLKGR